jgi:hypothetical protein
MSNLNSDPLKAKWQHQLEAAKQLWSKLTEDKLSGVNSHEKKLDLITYKNPPLLAGCTIL